MLQTTVEISSSRLSILLAVVVALETSRHQSALQSEVEIGRIVQPEHSILMHVRSTHLLCEAILSRHQPFWISREQRCSSNVLQAQEEHDHPLETCLTLAVLEILIESTCQFLHRREAEHQA